MLWTPNAGAVRVIHNTGIVGGQIGTSVVAGASNTYGTATEILAAADNNQDSWGITLSLTLTGVVGTATQSAVDILIGGATDDVLISSLLCGYNYQGSLISYFFPLHIPGGVRLAARSACVTASKSVKVGVWLHGGGVPPFRIGNRVTTYGVKVNDARGKALTTPGASGGTATVTEMTASTDREHSYLMPGFQVAGDSTISSSYVNLGIGVGASTEHRVGTWWWTGFSDERSSGYVPGLGAFVCVPAASRLSLLASNNVANDSAYDGHIYAV